MIRILSTLYYLIYNDNFKHSLVYKYAIVFNCVCIRYSIFLNVKSILENYTINDVNFFYLIILSYNILNIFIY